MKLRTKKLLALMIAVSLAAEPALVPVLGSEKTDVTVHVEKNSADSAKAESSEESAADSSVDYQASTEETSAAKESGADSKENAEKQNSAQENASPQKSSDESSVSEKSTEDSVSKAASIKVSGQKESDKQDSAKAGRIAKKKKKAKIKRKTSAKKLSVMAEEESDETTVVDNSTSLTDGTYQAADFTFSGGTGKVKITCASIEVVDGKAYADITFSSTSFTKLQASGKTYEGKIDEAAGTTTYRIPIALGKDNKIIGTTLRMSEPHDITYTIKAVVSDEASEESAKEEQETPVSDHTVNAGTTSEEESSSDKNTSEVSSSEESANTNDSGETDAPVATTESDNDAESTAPEKQTEVSSDTADAYVDPSDVSAEPSNPDNPSETPADDSTDPSVNPSDPIDDPSNPSDPSVNPDQPAEEDTDKIADGAYRVTADTDNRMFYILEDSSGVKYGTLEVSEGTYKITITLTGTGYDYLYTGTAEEASAADKSAWSHYQENDGYYSYTIDVPVLDQEFTVAAHSQRLNTWYEHKFIVYSADRINVNDIPAEDPDSGNTDPVNPDNPINPGSITNPTNSSGKKDKTNSTTKKDTPVVDKTPDKVSSLIDDSNKSTSSVDSSTTLKDGVYTPDAVSWSGGSGRLSYITCTKITVLNGKTYGTIVFGSSSYDQLKANGKIYSGSIGGGTTTFVIPIKLNANNTIIGRTTAMSQPHWVEYSIYISKAISADGTSAKTTANTKTLTNELSKEAPEILGLTTDTEVEAQEIAHAKYFKIFSYDQDIKLIQINLTEDTALYQEEETSDDSGDTETANEDAGSSIDTTEATDSDTTSQETVSESDSSETEGQDTATEETSVQYDEEGNRIVQSQHEITEALYQNNVINYLVVPEGVEIPAGLDKSFIIIQQPADSSYVASEAVLDFMKQLGVYDQMSSIGFEEEDLTDDTLRSSMDDESLAYGGSYDAPDFRTMVLEKTNLCILPSDLLPEEIKEDASYSDKELAALEEEKETKKALLETLAQRFTALEVPVLVDRSSQEEDDLAKAEWIKVYGTIYGCEEKAEQIYNAYVTEHSK